MAFTLEFVELSRTRSLGGGVGIRGEMGIRKCTIKIYKVIDVPAIKQEVPV